MSKLIQCGDHSFAPWCCVCVHLLDGSAKQWCPVPIGDEGEVESDWVCPDCLTRCPDLEPNDLRAVCMHCLRRLRAGA